jgi:hypothetical protein
MCVFANSDPNPNKRPLKTQATIPGGSTNASVENCIGACKHLGFVGAGMEQSTCCMRSTYLDELPFTDNFSPLKGVAIRSLTTVPVRK